MSTSRSLAEDRTRQVAAAQRQVFANAMLHFPQLSKCHLRKLKHLEFPVVLVPSEPGT